MFLSKRTDFARRAAWFASRGVGEIVVAWLLAAVMLGALAVIPSGDAKVGNLDLARSQRPFAMHPAPRGGLRAADAIEPCDSEEEDYRTVASWQPQSMSPTADAENC